MYNIIHELRTQLLGLTINSKDDKQNLEFRQNLYKELKKKRINKKSERNVERKGGKV